MLDLKFTVKIRDENGKLRRISVDLKKEAKITKAKLNTELVEQPGRYAWIATLCEMARIQRDEGDALLKRTAAEMDMEFRTNGLGKEIKVTETAIGHAILISKEYQEAQQEAFVARRDYGLLQAARDTMSQRKDVLMSLSANLRSELEQQL